MWRQAIPSAAHVGLVHHCAETGLADAALWRARVTLPVSLIPWVLGKSAQAARRNHHKPSLIP